MGRTGRRSVDQVPGARSPLRRLLRRRVWLPAAIYGLLPWAYLVAGGGALLAAVTLPDPGWLGPYLLLLGLSLVHGGTAVAGLRRRRRLAMLRQERGNRGAAADILAAGGSMGR